jgi:hypothetical protein
VALVAVSALLGAVLLGGGQATSAVWAARTALAEGQPVLPEDLVRREVRFAEPADRDRYLSAEQPLPGSGVLVRDVGAGGCGLAVDGQATNRPNRGMMAR